MGKLERHHRYVLVARAVKHQQQVRSGVLAWYGDPLAPERVHRRLVPGDYQRATAAPQGRTAPEEAVRVPEIRECVEGDLG